MNQSYRRIALTLLVAVAALCAGLPFAGATHLAVQDERDTDGPLDISRVRVVGKEEPRWIVSTYRGWSIAALRDSGFFVLELDTFGNAHFDYYVLVRSNGDRLVGSLWRDHQRSRDERLRTIRLSRPTAASLRMRLPLKRIHFGSSLAYQWRVTTMFAGDGCRRTCLDHAPSQGRVSEPVPGTFSPSPTPTFTLVPSESPSETPTQTASPAPTSAP